MNDGKPCEGPAKMWRICNLGVSFWHKSQLLTKPFKLGTAITDQ